MTERAVAYISLQGDVLDVGLGGKAHVEGIIESISEQRSLSVVMPRSEKLRGASEFKNQVRFINLRSRNYLSRVGLWILRDAQSSVLLFRKELLGLWLVFFVRAIDRLLGLKNHKYIMEVNGISGDYRLKGRFFRKVLAYLNFIPLYFMDAVYCVDENIRTRLVGWRPSVAPRVFVCKNGGGMPIVSPSSGFCGTEAKATERTPVRIVYLGGNIGAYALDLLVDAVEELVRRRPELMSSLSLELVGPGLEQYASRGCVNVRGRREVEDLPKMFCAAHERVWGVIPLRNIETGRDIEPVKTFDYMRCGYPILYSVYCLSELRGKDAFGLPFDPESKECTIDALLRIMMMPEKEYAELQTGAVAAYPDFTWRRRLVPLLDRIDHFVRSPDEH